MGFEEAELGQPTGSLLNALNHPTSVTFVPPATLQPHLGPPHAVSRREAPELVWSRRQTLPFLLPLSPVIYLPYLGLHTFTEGKGRWQGASLQVITFTLRSQLAPALREGELCPAPPEPSSLQVSGSLAGSAAEAPGDLSQVLRPCADSSSQSHGKMGPGKLHCVLLPRV